MPFVKKVTLKGIWWSHQSIWTLTTIKNILMTSKTLRNIIFILVLACANYINFPFSCLQLLKKLASCWKGEKIVILGCRVSFLKIVQYFRKSCSINVPFSNNGCPEISYLPFHFFIFQSSNLNVSTYFLQACSIHMRHQNSIQGHLPQGWAIKKKKST